jgi:hypothetical protein
MKGLIQGPRIRGDAQTVTHYMQGKTIRDPAVLEQQAKSVVVIAETFEAETRQEGAEDSGERKERT